MSGMAAHPWSADTAEELEQIPKGDLLLPYQNRLLNSVSRSALVIVEKSRRIGATWGLGYDSVLRAATSREDGGMNVMYISYSMEMTREFIDACAVASKILHGALVDVEEYMFQDEDADKEINAFRISFASGFKIQALSSAPRSIRGKQGLVIIDEAAFVDNLKELVKAAMAMRMWGGRLVVISTHNGVDNPFNRLLDEVKAEKRKGEAVKITFDDAIRDGLYERIKLLTKNQTDFPQTREEFVADVRGFYGDDASEELDVIPSAGGGSWIHPALIATATGDPLEVGPHAYKGGFCYVGYDVARNKDLSVISVYEDVGGVLVQREIIVMENWRFKRQYAEFDRVMKQYRVVRAGLDKTGLGLPVFERCEEKFGPSRVQGIAFSASSKLDMATNLRERFEDEAIIIGPDGRLRSDLLSIKKSGGSGGTPVFKDDGNTDGHADRFWSSALVATVSKVGFQEFAYHSAARGAEDDRRRGVGFVRTTSGMRGRRGTYG